MSLQGKKYGQAATLSLFKLQLEVLLSHIQDRRDYCGSVQVLENILYLLMWKVMVLDMY
jgi:hypothetical protein